MKFQFLNFDDDEDFFGDVILVVDTSGSQIKDSDIEMLIDGEIWSVGFIEDPLDDDKSHRVNFTIPSQFLANGEHTINIRYSKHNANFPETIYACVSNFHNTISAFAVDAVFMPIENSAPFSQTCRISAHLSQSEIWKVSVQDFDGKIVKVYQDSGSVIDINWNGTDESNQSVPDDTYTVKVSVLSSGVFVEQQTIKNRVIIYLANQNLG